jgi:hypothetical protein
MKPHPWLIPLLFLFAACGAVPSNPAKADVNDTASDSAACIAVVRNMLQWYKANHQRLDSIPVVAARAPGDSSRFRVDFDAVRKYIGEIRSAGIFTEGFLHAKSDYFRRVEDTLARTDQNDGPPEGLESDLFLYTQEYDAFLAEAPRMRIHVGPPQASGMRAVAVNGESGHLLFSVMPADGKWLIDKITPGTQASQASTEVFAKGSSILGIWAALDDANATFVISKDSINYPDHGATYKYELDGDQLHIKFDGFVESCLVRMRGADTLLLIDRRTDVFRRFR